MKTYKISNLFLIIFFVLGISIPSIFLNYKRGQKSVDENRMLANFPNLYTNQNELNNKFTKEFETWFNDNLGFRNKFVKVNTKLQYKTFRKLTRTDTLLGKEDWTYLISPAIIQDYQQLNLPSENQLISWGNSLKRINDYLKKKNIAFVLMINPDKKTIYPEHYPDTILKIGKISRTYLVTTYLQKHTNIDFVCPKAELLAAKSYATVYSPRVDSVHWNNYGAFIGYLALMDKIKKYYPNINILSWNDFEITRVKTKTKIYTGFSLSEDDYVFQPKNKSEFIVTKEPLHNLNLSVSNAFFRSINNNKKLPKLLIMGDSYIYMFLLQNLAQSFSEFTFIHSFNIQEINKIVEIYKPDMVIFEFVEHALNINPYAITLG